MLKKDWLGFPRDFPDSFKNYFCFAGRLKFVHIDLPIFIFALIRLKEFKLVVVGWLLNLRRADCRSQITVLLSLSGHGVLRLFDGEVFGIVSFG